MHVTLTHSSLWRRRPSVPGEILRPLGLTVERRQYPVSPRSEAAYAQINTEFDRLFQELYSKADQLVVSSMQQGPASQPPVVLAPMLLTEYIHSHGI